MKHYVLDACSLIAVLNKENGAESVKRLLEQPTTEVKMYMNIINLLEVYYGILREYGNETADNILLSVKSSSIEVVDMISDLVFREAGRLKSQYKISLADSIVLAEGITRNAKVISSDHHEFDIVEQKEKLDFFWFR